MRRYPDMKKGKMPLEGVRILDIGTAVAGPFGPTMLSDFGAEALKEVNEKIILVRVSGYGQDGPYKDKPGYDRIGQAVAGLINVTGYPEHPPVKAGFAVCDYMTGIMNAL